MSSVFFLSTAWLLVGFVPFTSTATTLSAPSRIKVDADGGYTGIVVQIDKDVPEEECGRILASLKVGRKHRFTVFGHFGNDYVLALIS